MYACTCTCAGRLSWTPGPGYSFDPCKWEAMQPLYVVLYLSLGHSTLSLPALCLSLSHLLTFSSSPFLFLTPFASLSLSPPPSPSLPLPLSPALPLSYSHTHTLTHSLSLHQTAYFRQHGCTAKEAHQKYNSRAAQLYREKLASLAANAQKKYGTEVSNDSFVLC